MTKSVRDNKRLAPIVKIRDWLMRAMGLFKLKATIKRKHFYAQMRREDAKIKNLTPSYPFINFLLLLLQNF